MDSTKSNHEVLLEASMPEGAVPLEAILRTEELHRRPWRPPDYEKENRALVALAIALADSPHTILHYLPFLTMSCTISKVWIFQHIR